MDTKTINRGTGVALGLVFLSGFAALVYQVLWMRQLGLLFGNTAHAAAATVEIDKRVSRHTLRHYSPPISWSRRWISV